MTIDPISWENAVDAFLSSDHKTQSSKHIKPFHKYCVDRLIFEGGFRPEHLSPAPAYLANSVENKGEVFDLQRTSCPTSQGEQTVLGGLKTKDVDVVVSQRCTGPALAISVKGTLKSFRNLTNRMEEAAGDCTNLHIAYPSLVYGFVHLIQALSSKTATGNNVALDKNDQPVDSIVRYHDAMSRIAGRKDLRNDVSRYEAIALSLTNRDPESGKVSAIPHYPEPNSPLHFDRFFQKLYDDYDLRYVYAAPKLRRDTQRVFWKKSALTDSAAEAGFKVRIAD